MAAPTAAELFAKLTGRRSGDQMSGSQPVQTRTRGSAKRSAEGADLKDPDDSEWDDGTQSEPATPGGSDEDDGFEDDVMEKLDAMAANQAELLKGLTYIAKYLHAAVPLSTEKAAGLMRPPSVSPGASTTSKTTPSSTTSATAAKPVSPATQL